MKDHTRRAVAFIAGSIVAKKKSSALYDNNVSQHFSFSGDPDASIINIYDYSEKCRISGSRLFDKLTLYHNGNSKHIDLKIVGTNFHGFDFDSDGYFSGNVNGTTISIYDNQHSKYFNYSI